MKMDKGNERNEEKKVRRRQGGKVKWRRHKKKLKETGMGESGGKKTSMEKQRK